MTDQTVPVPVDLLKRLFDNTTLTRDAFEGDSVDVRPSGIGALIDIKALVPVPPKVGETVTSETAPALIAGTVLRDKVGDIWFVKDDYNDVKYVRPTQRADTLVNASRPDYNYYRPVVISLPNRD